MAEDTGSTVPRRELGRMLKQLRIEAGVTLDGAAEALECSRQKLWRIEAGLGPARALDVRALCELYQVNATLGSALIGLAAETRAKGWWHAYSDAIPDWFEPYVGLEAAASRLRFFKETLVPGIVQTREYAHGMYLIDQPDITEDERERAVQVRLQRQALLRRRLPEAPRVELVLSEAVLLRPIDSRRTMAEQLRRLLQVTEQFNVSIRILPLSVGPHRGSVAGEFVLLNFPPGRRTTPEPSVVYSESLTGALYLDRPEEFAAYERVWSALESSALDESQSMNMINKIMGEVYHD
jgi:transcriptional regulator with XRE-family HTH domain